MVYPEKVLIRLFLLNTRGFRLDKGSTPGTHPKMPRKKFNRDQADKVWQEYTKTLIQSISQAESDGLDKGYSSFEIEKLWQARVKEKSIKSVSTDAKAKFEKEEAKS